ncbi:MAG: glycosyltransferase [Fibromonadaceae bacterium]|jgi:glycosyltransferase involved in cell wall biosynthesis|nr:glycosyltransferase [Fibromonadaceae bacterium]
MEDTQQIPYAFELAVLKYPEETKNLISIIIPIYNAKELYLREALDSVIAQTFENWEAILVNDGSTDKIVEKICMEYAEKNLKFKYIYKNNEGALLARKSGLENSKGEFIAYLDSDDAYHPQYLEKMFAKIKERDNDFVWCNYEDLDKKVKFLKGDVGAKYYKFNENSLENCRNISKFLTNLWNKLVKRSIWAKILFLNANYICGTDTPKVLQIIYHSKKAEFIPDRLYLYRFSSTNSVTFSDSVKQLRLVQYTTHIIVVYMLMKRFFGADEAENFLASRNEFRNYFLLSKDAIIHHKIEYVENFVPAFLRGLKRAKDIGFFKKTILILACKDFPLPFIFCHKAKNMCLHIKAGLYNSIME